MLLYLSIIFLGAFMIGFANAELGATDYGTAFLWVGIDILIMVVIDAVVALLVRALPERKINPFLPLFIPSDGEKKLYAKLGVRSWKDVIPETGKYLCNFAKDKVYQPNDNKYVLKFLRETVYAGVMHLISMLLSFVPLIFVPYKWSIMLPVAIINAFLQLLPVIVQRYNRTRLVTLYRFNERRERAAAQRTQQEVAV